MRRALAAVWLVLAALLLGGCFRLELAVEVRPDGSGTAREVFAVDRQKAEDVLGASDGLTLALPRAENISNLPSWARATPYRDGRLEGVAVDLDFPAASELGPRLAVLTEAITGSVGSPARSDVVLRREGEGWRFDAHQRHMSLRPDPSALGSEIRAALYDTAELRLSVRLPGRIVEHNADHVDGNLLTWDVPVGADSTDLFATSAPLGGGGRGALPRAGRLAVAALAAAGLGGAALGGALVLQRRPGSALPSPAATRRPPPARAGQPPPAGPTPPAMWPSTPPPNPPTRPPPPGP